MHLGGWLTSSFCARVSKAPSPSQPPSPDGRLPRQVHYDNLCMKAVNQSIGRSIRHAKDYATIVLVDQRYARTSVREKLPEWIASQLKVCQGFGQAFAAIRKVLYTISERHAV